MSFVCLIIRDVICMPQQMPFVYRIRDLCVICVPHQNCHLFTTSEMCYLCATSECYCNLWTSSEMYYLCTTSELSFVDVIRDVSFVLTHQIFSTLYFAYVCELE
eukprot:TRINITY_DN45605_c0_g1_i4.p1 TRINITY_DN45605_c0_g1~~TRINITY_DN45605_c0_g1_i4.p1  ORF type:complete len:104 (-),score=7.84 TRINITY_DN45605_c0_g1_i4:66-377(-)